MSRIALISLAVLPLAACNLDADPAGNTGTEFTLNATTADGNTVVASNNDGRLRIKAPGFEGSIRMPRIALDADQLDLDGAKLFPGTSIDSMNIDGRERRNGPDEGRVRIAFTSPAAMGEVSRWLREEFSRRGMPLSGEGAALSGRTREGKTLRIELSADGDARTKGVLTAG